MSRVRVHNFSVSLDGFGTGEGQSLEAPFGHPTFITIMTLLQMVVR